MFYKVLAAVICMLFGAVTWQHRDDVGIVSVYLLWLFLALVFGMAGGDDGKGPGSQGDAVAVSWKGAMA